MQSTHPGDIKTLIIKLRGFTPELYLDLPLDLAHRLGIKRGAKLRCLIHKLEDRYGNLILENRELELEIKQRDFRAFLPRDLVQHLGLVGAERVELEILS